MTPSLDDIRTAMTSHEITSAHEGVRNRWLIRRMPDGALSRVLETLGEAERWCIHLNAKAVHDLVVKAMTMEAAQ